MKLGKLKCHVLHHGGKSLCNTTSWGAGSGVTVGSEPNVSQLYALEAKVTSILWGCVNRNIGHRLREGIIPLYMHLNPPLGHI